MVLEVGKGGKVRFVRGIKKTNIFEIGEYGMVVEREKNIISLYATDNRCSKIYCTVTLGNNSILKGKKPFVVGAFAKDILVLDAYDILVVVDYAQQKIAVNRPEISVSGKDGWGRMEWESCFNVMFGLDVSPEDQAAADALKYRSSTEFVMQLDQAEEVSVPETSGDERETFWSWFASKEEEIVEKTLAGGEEAEIITARLRVRLSVLFPYEKPENVEFSLGGDGERNCLTVYHFNSERMKADIEALFEAMPAELSERWYCQTEA